MYHLYIILISIVFVITATIFVTYISYNHV